MLPAGTLTVWGSLSPGVSVTPAGSVALTTFTFVDPAGTMAL